MTDTRAVALGLVLWTAFAIGCGQAEASDAELAGGSVTQWTDSTELFMEYPALIVGDSGRFAIHLTDLTDFAPLAEGRVTLRFIARDGGEPVIATQDGPRAPGIFGASPHFTRPGAYDLVLLVDSPQARDSLFIPNLTVYASAEDVPGADEAEASGISFLKEQQWKTPGFATTFAVLGTATETFEVAGRIVPAAGRYAEVQAPVAGLIDLAGLEPAPAPGARVTRGQVLAVLTPATTDAGNVPAQARATLREAEDEFARAQRLVSAGAAPQRRLHEAEIRVDAAREAMAGLGGSAEGGRYLIRAPISGVIGERNALPGARAQAGATLFTVIDPDVVWLQSYVPPGRVPSISRSEAARFQVEGVASEFATDRLVSIGASVDATRRMIPVLHQVSNARAELRIGAAVRVALSTGVQRAGVLVPASAVLDDNGLPVLYVQKEGELFELRRVTLGGRNGSSVLVLDGIAAGDRIVSGAAFQVRLASLSTAVPAHGHEH